MDTKLVALQTTQQRIDLIVRGERFATYQYESGSMPGFAALYAPGERAVTRQNAAGLGLWLGYGDVNGVAFTPESHVEAAAGRIVPMMTIGRRGRQTIGFQQECAWLAPDGRTLLTDLRTVRALPGPGEGRILDIAIQILAPAEAPIVYGRTDHGLLAIDAATALFPMGMGQVCNSRGEYGPEEIDGHAAAWCACVGVIQGATVGFVLLDHPSNLSFPPRWTCREDGILSPSPFAWSSSKIAPGKAVTLRYRLFVHAGYVEAGWPDARLAEFAQYPD